MTQVQASEVLHDHPLLADHSAAIVLSPQHELMRDAAYADNISAIWTGAVGGYLNTKPLGAGDPFHGWSDANWLRFKDNRKLPIFVQSAPILSHAENEAWIVLRELYRLGVPRGVRTALDLETAVNQRYVQRYGQILNWGGYRVWVYGSASTVFNNPPINGYWVADYVANHLPFMYDHPDVRTTQYTDNKLTGGRYDSSTVKDWVYADKAHWWI